VLPEVEPVGEELERDPGLAQDDEDLLNHEPAGAEEKKRVNFNGDDADDAQEEFHQRRDLCDAKKRRSERGEHERRVTEPLPVR